MFIRGAQGWAASVITPTIPRFGQGSCEGCWTRPYDQCVARIGPKGRHGGTNTAKPSPYSYTHKFPSRSKDVTDELALSEGRSSAYASTELHVGYAAPEVVLGTRHPWHIKEGSMRRERTQEWGVGQFRLARHTTCEFAATRVPADNTRRVDRGIRGATEGQCRPGGMRVHTIGVDLGR